MSVFNFIKRWHYLHTKSKKIIDFSLWLLDRSRNVVMLKRC